MNKLFFAMIVVVITSGCSTFKKLTRQAPVPVFQNTNTPLTMEELIANRNARMLRERERENQIEQILVDRSKQVPEFIWYYLMEAPVTYGAYQDFGSFFEYAGFGDMAGFDQSYYSDMSGALVPSPTYGFGDQGSGAFVNSPTYGFSTGGSGLTQGPHYGTMSDPSAIAPSPRYGLQTEGGGMANSPRYGTPSQGLGSAPSPRYGTGGSGPSAVVPSPRYGPR